MSVITISRQMCSFGDEIATALSQKLGWELITRDALLADFLPEIATRNELHMLTESAKFYLKESENNGTFLEYIDRTLHDLAQEQSVILAGFGSQVIFANDKDALHIRIIAPKKNRVARLKKQYNVSDIEAEQILKKADRKQTRFVFTIFGVDLTEPSYYNLLLNTAALSVDECVASITALLKERELLLQMEKQTEDTNVISNLSDMPVLKNQAEIEFAKILDMYQIDWKYEPKIFPIEWDPEGNITSAFSPDFYLTKFDTYIELTTMNQKYVTEKNKKVKKLRELYPGINVKVVYKKDYHSLIERFNVNKGE
ncbi:MAG: cytidylate kinase family protein [Eubacteriales bacterium]|nr:cytidylate kinase family protein [Eubacteriales bacterium]